MADRTLPNLGLKGFWPEGEDHWGDDNDWNLLALSVLVQAGVDNKVSALPGSPTNGDIVLCDETVTGHENKVAVRDNGAWVYFTPREGWLVWDRTGNQYLSFNGTVWAVLETGGGGGVEEAPEDGTPYARQDADWVSITGGGSSGGVYRVGGFFGPTPTDAEVLLIHSVTDPFILPANLVGSQFSVAVDPVADCDFSLALNGVEFAVITVATDGSVTIVSDEVPILADDTLTLTGPATADGTVAGVSYTFRGAGAAGASGHTRTLASARIDCTDTSTPVIASGYNVASVSKTGTGRYTVAFTTDLPDLTKVGFSGGGRWATISTLHNGQVVSIDMDTGKGLKVDEIDIVIHAIADDNAANGEIFDADDWFSFELYDVTIPARDGGGSGETSSTDTTKFLGSFDKWIAAKARGAGEPARCLFLGDSNVSGLGSIAAGSWTGAWLTGFARQFADLQGWQTGSILGNQNVDTNTTIVHNYNPAITFGGGWGIASGGADIVGGTFFHNSSGGGGTLTFTPTEEFSFLRFYYPRASGLNGAVTITVDSVLVDTVSENGGNAILFVDHTLSLGTHTVEISQSGSGEAYTHGIEFNDGTDTPVFLQAGWSGAKAADLAKTTSAWSSLNQIGIMEVDYAFIYCTLNDTTSETAGSTYYNAMEALVRTVSATGDGCILVGIPGDSGGTVSSYLNNLAVMLRQLAADYGWSFYDFRQDFGYSWKVANDRNLVFDTVHPNFDGHTLMAGELDTFIGGSM